MSRCLSGAWLALGVAAALAGSACGRYGPPVRAHERAAKREQPAASDRGSAAQPAPTPGETPAEEQAAPDQEP
jgi:hypothetical protein